MLPLTHSKQVMYSKRKQFWPTFYLEGALAFAYCLHLSIVNVLTSDKSSLSALGHPHRNFCFDTFRFKSRY